MLKEMIANKLEQGKSIVYVGFSCLGATLDTIRDEEVHQAWKAKKHDIKEITKKQNKTLETLYKEYKTKVNKVNKQAKQAKKIVKDQFSAVVKETFNSHLEKRVQAKTAKSKRLAARA